MDLQSILNASDSSEELYDEDVDLGGVDIEHILREGDDEASDDKSDSPEDVDFETITRKISVDETDHEKLPSSSTKARARFIADNSHSAGDWAILQSILLGDDDEADDDEDDDDDEQSDDVWLNDRNSSADVRSYVKQGEFHLKDSLLGDDNEEDNNPNRLASNLAMSNVTRPNEFLLEESSNKENGSTFHLSYYQPSITPQNADVTNTAQHKHPTKDLIQEKKSEAISRKSLAYASSYEQKLLKSGQREMVSPLRVKRRLKQKVELTARGKESKQSSRIASLAVTRFGSSGIVENRKMQGVSSSLEKHSSEGAKVLCGLPTCLAFNNKFIAVGTQRGIVLVYDLFEVLRQRLGATYDDNLSALRAGSVTSVDLSFNGEAVIAGHSTGMVVLWDTIRGIVLRAVSDTHLSPVSSVRFMNEMKIVSVDVAGLVNKISFTKNMLWANYSMDTECLLDGTAGQILAINVLAPYSTVKNHLRPDSLSPFLRKLKMIALSSERSSFAVAVEPQVNVLHRWARPPSDRIDALTSEADPKPGTDFLPCLSWGWGLVTGGGNKVMPILARAWGCCLQLLCSSFPTVDDETQAVDSSIFHWPAFGLHKEIDTEHPVVSIEWLDERSIVYLTVTNEFNLVDTVMSTLLERLSFSNLKLVYAEFSLSRSIRNPVGERAVEQVPITTFQNSIRYNDDRLMILCRDALQCISIVGSRRRISSLEEGGEWLEALALALDYYESSVLSQEDRKRDPSGRKDLSRHPDLFKAKSDDEEWLSKLLVRYLTLAVENAPESDVVAPYSRNANGVNNKDLAHSHFQMLAGVCIEYCVVTRKSEVLFGPVFQRFYSAGYSAIFFDVLEPYILNDRVPYIGAEAMSYFVEHCKATKGITTVERCLLHMDCSIMDFDTILSLLRRNSMYTALFYVYNSGLEDFITPLELLMDRVFEEADAGSAVMKRREDGVPQTDFERCGYKALLYLRVSLGGYTFPKEEEVKFNGKRRKICTDLLSFLAHEKYVISARQKDADDGALGHRGLSYPYLRLLLLVDARELLEVLSIGLDFWNTQVYQSESDQSQEVGYIETPNLQDFVRMLSFILQADSCPPGMTMSTLRLAKNAFLDFTANYILKGSVKVEPEITYLILSRKSDVFVASTTTESRLKAQREVMDIISSLPRDSYDPDKVLSLINSTGMHRAALLLHQQVASMWVDSAGSDDIDIRCRHFQNAINCYIEDEDQEFRMDVYTYIRKECSGVRSTSDENGMEPRSLRHALFSKLPALCRLSALRTASLVADLFVDDIDEVVQSMDSSHDDQFAFLHAIASGVLAQQDPAAASMLILTMEHYHKYLSLMAKLHPEMIYDYLQSHDNYRTEECLELCEKYDIPDATVYLLEKTDKINEAIRLGLQTLESRMMEMKRTIRGMEIDSFRKEYSLRRGVSKRNGSTGMPGRYNKTLESLKRMLTVVLDVCERKSIEQGSRLWFTVLDRLITSKGFLRLSKEQPQHAKVMANVLSDLLRQTMQRMVSNVPLPDLVQKVTTHNSGSDLGELREMVDSLLATYNFELKVFEGVSTVFSQDVHNAKAQQRGLRVKGSPVDPVDGLDLPRKAKFKTLLRIGGTRTASVTPWNQESFSKKAESSLSNAIGKLRSRRGGRLRDAGKGAPSLNRVTFDQSVGHVASEPVVTGPRPVRALGEAQHHGHLVLF